MVVKMIEKCVCGNDNQSKFTVTVFGPNWSGRENNGLYSSCVNCLMCGMKGNKRQGAGHRKSSDAAIDEWNNNGRYKQER